MVLGSVSAAYAGTITYWTVGPTGDSLANRTVLAQGTSNNDGVPLISSSLKFYIDGVLRPRSSYTGTVNTNQVYVYYAPEPKLVDGTHTFRVEVSDSAGKLSSKQWTTRVVQPPSAAWLAPSAGSTSFNGRPPIVMSLSDNTPGTKLTVAGQVRSGGSTGPVVATFGGNNLSTGSNTFSVSSELAFGSYHLTATVTDAAGNTMTLGGAASRSFTTVSAPAMTVLERCDGCHAPVRSDHPTPASSDCVVCHPGNNNDDHMEGTGYCEDCHWDDFHGDGGVAVTSECASCHAASRPSIVRHTAASTSGAHESSCGGCHYGTLIAEHAVTTMGSSYAYQCDVCHGSTDANVQAAIMTENTSCAACHLSGFHTGFAEKHTYAGMDASCQAQGCHAASLVDAHAAFVGPEGRYPLYADTCALCHSNADPGRVPAGASAECGSCHAQADHESLHVTDVPASCGSCHSATSLTSLHINPATTLTCGTCHDSVDPEVEAAIAADDLSCSACHTAQGTDFHVDFAVKHTYAGMDASCQGAGCHANELVEAHDAYVGTGNRYSQYADTCALCHSNADPERVPAGATADCTSCHTEIHGDIGVIHTAVVTSANMSILGTNFGSHACSECHASTDLRTLHGGTSSCGTCHPTPASTATPWAGGCVQGGCHTVGSDAPQHGEVDSSHTRATGTASDSCVASGCHAGGTNIAAIHTDQGCDTCHAEGLTPTDDCASCHDAGSQHDDLIPLHQSSGGADFISAGLEGDGDHDLGYGTYAGCSDCHSTGLMVLHGNYCGACHSSSAPAAVKTAVANNNTSCTACHPSQHQVGNGSHQDIYYSGCDCHDYDWNNPTATCTDCHPATAPAPDPSTISDAKPSYINDAVINLTASDNLYGTFGIRATHYVLDGATEAVGTQVIVQAPASGTESHTLTFWSDDWSGNVELPHTVAFTVTADSFPPVTTSNVVEGKLYAGNQTFTLSPTDANSNVAGTWWQLDSTAGAWTAGTSIPITAPTSGTVARTLYFYSRDGEGNAETIKSANFSVVAGKDFTHTTTLQTYVVPSGVTALSVTVDGGGGGNSVFTGGTYNYGGGGGRVSAIIPVTPGQTLTMRVGAAGAPCSPWGYRGSGGWPNGANGNQYGGGGGGSSSVWLGGTVLVEAGGGGGAGSSVTIGAGGAGGAQGTLPGGYKTGTVPSSYGAGGGAGGWNAGAGGGVTYGGGTGGTSYIATGSGTLTPGAVTGNGSVQIRFAEGVTAHTLTYIAGSGGTITGTSPQTVLSGGSGTAVTAVAATGRHFVNWSDGVTTATRTDSNVTANKTVTANFALNTYTLTYTAGAGGSISGTNPQTVNHGTSGAAVTAVANAGFYFVDWSDGRTTATRTDLNVTANKSVTANFAPDGPGVVQTTSLVMNDYTWVDAELGASGGWGAFSIYANGTLIGTKPADGTTTWSCPQMTVPSGARIDIVADVGFWAGTYIYDEHRPITYTTYLPLGTTRLEAGEWSGFPNLEVNDSYYSDYSNGDYTYVLVPPATITNIRYTVGTPPPSYYTLTYTAGSGGSVSGTSPQSVISGGSGTAVTAVPDVGYHFVNWSDGVATATRTDSNVTVNKTATANFAPDSGVPQTTSLSIDSYTYVDANEGASGAWATYKIYVNDVLIGTKTAGPDTTWSCPQIDLPSGGRIDIVTDCGFTDYDFLWAEGRPNTYTITLPAGTSRLEAATWTGFSDKSVITDYWEPYDEVCTWVDIAPTTIGNIVYTAD